MAGHRHYWRSQSTVFMQNGLGNWIAIMWGCKCGAARGYVPDSEHEDAAELAYELERAGDFYLTPGALSWLAARRALCPM